MSEFFNGFVREVKRFIDAVDWTQRWLWILGIYFFLLFALLMVFRRSTRVQTVMLVVLALHVFMAQPINTWASANWKLFASENYFGENGFFVTIVYGFPLLVLGVLAVINLLLGTARLAVTVKRMELQRNKREQEKKNQ